MKYMIRSPLILDDVSMGIWLSDENPENIHKNISHDFGSTIEYYQVTRSVNNPKNNNAHRLLRNSMRFLFNE